LVLLPATPVLESVVSPVEKIRKLRILVMKLVFLETPLFSRLRAEKLSDESMSALQLRLLECPELGDVMPGTGGFRKLRWRDESRGKGKRGGLRVVYYYLAEYRQIWLFTLYVKHEVSDLTAAEKAVLKAAVARELAARKVR
jgi:hypothetical protein